MRRVVLLQLVLFFSITLCAACSPGSEPSRTDSGVGDGGIDTTADADGDTIADAHEGARTERDTDGDGTPDFMDLDSDQDGIPDMVEAGDADTATEPIDSDSDGTPDYLDDDSDDNGILDGDEVDGDADGDGILNFADLDDDNDLVQDRRELDGITDPPVDTDGDGLPDYQDPDSDDDFILDGHEFGADTDEDGLPDVVDLDSDGDGLSDADEAGDMDIRTVPVNSDDDEVPDFRDTDSDNDGLLDGDEVMMHGTDPTVGDTDGDGVSDLIEVAGETDPTDPDDNPRTRGDFVFVVEYEEPPDPERDTLHFRTSIQFADVYFLFDKSGSMGTEIEALQMAVTTVINDLTCMDFGVACARDADCGADQVCSLTGSCIEDPGMSSCVASPWTGGGWYLHNLTNVVSIQPDPMVTSSGLTFGTSGATEKMNLAAWCTADPMGCPGSPSGCDMPMAGRVGCPSFRDEAVKILVTFTDEDSDGSESSMNAGMALSDNDITYIGVWSGSTPSGSRSDMVSLATDSGSLDSTGMPLVFDGRDAAVVPAVTAAINEIVEGVPLRVTIDATDEPDDAGDSLQFIDHLETNTSDSGCTDTMTEDSDGDGIQDAFPSVTPGTPVCWDVVPLMNTTVMPTERPQVFRARLTVYGDGSPLDSRIVYFLVPPEIEDIPVE